MSGSIVPPLRKLIFIPGAQFRSAVSEELIQRLSETLNLISMRQYDQKEYFLNGQYGTIGTVPQLGVDGLYVVPFNMEIINYSMFNLVPGVSGTTELDIKRATTSGGAFTSLFSVTPKISSAAAANTFFLGYTITDISTGQSWAPNASPPTGVTIGTFTSIPLSLNAGDALRVDILNRMPSAQNCGLVVNFRPR